MNCSCPKCDALIETNHLEVSAKGSSINCPECNDKFWAIREGFALRAYKKQGRIYCFDCGEELGTEHLCVNCGSQCPDYCIVQAAKPVPRKQQKAGFEFSFARKSKDPKPSRLKPSLGRQPSSAEASPDKGETKTGSRWMIYAGILVVSLVLLVATGKAYMGYKADKEYSKGFVTALYGVKSGTDECLKMIDALAAKWERETGSERGMIPRMEKKDRERLVKIKSRVDQAVDGMIETPEKFSDAKAKLGRLHGIYEQIYDLALSSPNDLDTFKSSRSKIETDFFRAASELKRAMPKVMMDELEISINKYKNLEFMVKS